MCGSGQKQYCREAYGHAASSGERNGDGLSFQDEESERDYQKGGYSGCGSGQT